MIVRRTFDAAPFEAIGNAADVRPLLGGEGVLDLRSFMHNARNVALATERGGFLFSSLGCGAYEVHTLFWPAKSADEAAHTLQAARDAMWWMFCNTDCVRIVTKVPHFNERARGLAERAGMASICTVTAGPAFGVVGAFDLLAVDLQSWALSDACEAMGIGGDDAPVCWKRATGALLSMLMAGQRNKALDWFNVWALAAGLPTAMVDADAPLVLSVAGQRLQFACGSVEIV